MNSIEPSIQNPKKISIFNDLKDQKKVKWVLFMRYFISQWSPEDEEKRQIWLREREIIFQRFCLPTLIPQLKKSGGKCVLFITKGYEGFLPNCISEPINDGFFEIVNCNLISESIEFSKKIVKTERDRLNENELLLVTRLDNDDALSKDYYDVFLSLINSDYYFNFLGKTISFPHGAQYDVINDEWYSYIFTNNHFLSVIVSKKDPGNFKGFYGNHSNLFLNEKDCLTLLTKMPMWTEVIHGKNIANKIRSAIKINTSVSKFFFE